MFELPECITLARQMQATIAGKTIHSGALGNSPHKFVWYNRTHDEFARLTAGRTFGPAHARGHWILAPLDPGYVLVIGECGGRLLYHPPGARLPDKYHLWLTFADGSALTLTTQMWGAMELHDAGRELERQYIQDMRPTPAEPTFTFDYFAGLLTELRAGEKRSVKALLTQDQLIPGLGNAIAQDIMFRAGLHPRHPITALDPAQTRRLYDAILAVLEAAIAAGGRADELDLFHHPGGYTRLMDSRAVGRPCPICSTPIEKMQYLGGACYFCPRCQT